jgi:hypothetical protein
MSEQPKTPPPSGLAVKVSPGITPSKQKLQEEVHKAGPTICLHVPLVGTQGNSPNIVIDFMKLAEDTYGYEVIHPDIRSVLDLGNDVDDNDDDDDNEDIDLMADGLPLTGQPTPGSTTPVGPVTAAASASVSNSTAGQEKPKSRGKVEGKYDLNDPFIDDSEMLWEEQAASTKDGFFVYSGPLVQAGELPQIERADGTIKRTKGDSSKAAGKGKGTTRGKKKEPAVKKPKVEKDAKEPKEKTVKPKKERVSKKSAAKDEKEEEKDSTNANATNGGTNGSNDNSHVLIAPKPKEEKEKPVKEKVSKKKADKSEPKVEGDAKSGGEKSTPKDTPSNKDSSTKVPSAPSEDSVRLDSSTIPDEMEGVEPSKPPPAKIMSINGLLDV